MLFKMIKNAISYLKRNKLRMRRILLLLAPIFLKLKLDNFKSMSFESLSSYFVFDPNTEFESEPTPFDSKPPHQTIFIKISGSQDFDSRVRDKISKLIIRSKSIIVSKDDISEHFFIKIYLKESKEDCLNVYPFNNYQPNSELFYICKTLFNSRIGFKFRYFFYSPFENSIELSLRNNYSSLIKFSSLLRYFSNIYSHYYGIYYYIPLKTKLIRAESLIPFILSVTLSLFLNSEIKINIFACLLTSILFFIMPISSIFFLNSKHKGILLVIFSIINLKMSFIFAIMCYLIEIIKEIKYLRKNKWKLYQV